MTDQALDILKLVLLGLLYLFFARVLWAVWSEVRRSQRVATPAPVDDQAATVAATAPRARKPPKGRRGRVGRLVIVEPKARRGATFPPGGGGTNGGGPPPAATGDGGTVLLPHPPP